MTEALKALEKLEVTRVRVEVPDLDGNLRGKYLPLEKVLGKDITLAEVFFTLSIKDEVRFSLVPQETGFPDIVFAPDWSTLRPIPWEKGLAGVICDVHSQTGRPHELACRHVLRAAVERCEGLGFDARFGVEFELILLEDEENADRALRIGQSSKLKPVGREWQAYSISRWSDLDEFVADLQESMLSYGVPIESVSTELGYGQIEVALAPAPPLEAADRTARFKLGCKQIARKHGMIATFIAKLTSAHGGSSGHVHQSLLRNKTNAFRDDASRQLSEVGMYYLGGLIGTAIEFSAVWCPFPNSFRRAIPGVSVPLNASWGYDNRNACCRVITRSIDSTRVEHRRPGADLHPYLAIAACLDGGMWGIRKEVKPPEQSPGLSWKDERAATFPKDLGTAAELLRQSVIPRELWGDKFVDYYADSRDEEAETWKALNATHIPEWEVCRYLETV